MTYLVVAIISILCGKSGLLWCNIIKHLFGYVYLQLCSETPFTSNQNSFYPKTHPSGCVFY